MALEELTRLYDAYVDTYRDESGELPVMMRLKRMHTAFVVRNAELIADGEGFSEEEREVALAAALLHDTGRYEQLKRYDTFRDSDSVDHAVFSHDIVVEKGWLDKADRVDSVTSGRETASPFWSGRESGEAKKESILRAVLYHNRRDLPGNMDSLTEVASHTVRDADKLDIFRVLEDRVEHTDWRGDLRAFWNLSVSAPPNPDVVECIEKGRPVDYQNIKSLSDFVLIQVGWMVSELHFATSRRLCRERNHLAYRRDFLHRLTDSPAIDRLCDIAARVLV